MHSSGLTTSPSRAVSSHTIHFLRTWSLTSARSFSGSPPRRDHSSQHLSWQMVETKRESCFLCNVIFRTLNYQRCLVSLASLSYLAAPPKSASGRKAPNTVQLPKSVSYQWWSHSLDPQAARVTMRGSGWEAGLWPHERRLHHLIRQQDKHQPYFWYFLGFCVLELATKPTQRASLHMQFVRLFAVSCCWRTNTMYLCPGAHT